MNNNRQAEIAAKRQKLAELKRQREVRQKEQNRGSIGGSGDVCITLLCKSLVVLQQLTTSLNSSLPRHREAVEGISSR